MDAHGDGEVLVGCMLRDTEWGTEAVRAGMWGKMCIITSIQNIERLQH